MGRKCSVPKCGSNYESRLRKGRNVISTFKFPEDPALRDRWVAAVGRPDKWLPKKTSCVCMNHFKPEDLEKLAKPAKLKLDAVPSLFGTSVAQYEQPKQVVDSPEELILDFDSFYALIIEEADFGGWHFYRMRDVVHFYNVDDTNRDSAIKIVNSIQIFPDMKVSLFVRDVKQPDVALRRVLGRDLKLCLWSQFVSLLKRYEFGPISVGRDDLENENGKHLNRNDDVQMVNVKREALEENDSPCVDTDRTGQQKDDQNETMLVMDIVKEETNLVSENDNEQDTGQSSEERLNIHETMRILTEAKHKCFICDREHETNEEYDYHLSQHNDMLPYQCERCVTEKVVIRTLPSLNKHFMMHLKPLKCRTCDARFSSYGPRLIHEKNYHTVSESVSCEICGEVALSQQRYDEHLKTHTDLEVVTCRTCDKQCITAYDLNVHMKSIHPSSASFNYEELSTMDPNVTFDVSPECANEKPKKEYFCIECNKALPNRNSYYSHMQSHRKQFQCGYCGVRIARLRDFRDHENTHTGKRPYECEICKMKFMASSTYYGHRATHKREKRFACEICGRTFSRLQHMVSHAQTHAKKTIRRRTKAKAKVVSIENDDPSAGKEASTSGSAEDVAVSDVKNEMNN
ncbi:zinc finger protein 568-like [Ochlerotatus camptorhynchus]|uniref:zinc finger protein 568-like n=1 Tax=Ochlerotatus camptorhynchus TaxID=644619 RepID=UPI0031E0BEF6